MRVEINAISLNNFNAYIHGMAVEYTVRSAKGKFSGTYE